MAEREERIRSYSGLFVIGASGEESTESVEKAIKGIIGDNAGSIVSEKKMGRRDLGTPMKKKKEGVYYELIFTAPSSSITKINRLCNITGGILRTLISAEKPGKPAAEGA